MNHISVTRRFSSFCSGSAGCYTVTAVTESGNVVQYSLFLLSKGWTLYLTYGNGPHFHSEFKTKKAAVKALQDHKG